VSYPNGATCLRLSCPAGQVWWRVDWGDEMRPETRLAPLLQLERARPLETRQCLAIGAGSVSCLMPYGDGGTLLAPPPSVGTVDPVAVFKKATLFRSDFYDAARQASVALAATPPAWITPMEADLRVLIHDCTTAHHEKSFYALTLFPLPEFARQSLLIWKVSPQYTLVLELIVGAECTDP
jgi:hypothetical protein